MLSKKLGDVTNQFAIGSRLALGFALVLMLSLLTTVVGVWQLQTTSTKSSDPALVTFFADEQKQSAAEIQRLLTRTR